MGCDVTYLKVCVWNMGSLRCLMKNKCQNRVPGHPIYKVGHNLTGFNNILEGGIVPLRASFKNIKHWLGRGLNVGVFEAKKYSP